MNKMGQFGEGFFAPAGMQAMATPFAGSFGGFFMQEMPIATGGVAYFPARRPDMKNGRRGWGKMKYPSWPFAGPAY